MGDSNTTIRTAGGVTLGGSLRLPVGTATGTAVLLVSGSGPLDRDTDAKRSPLGISRQLADALAREGVASLRYDKRGVGASDGDFLSAGMTDNIADAAAALSHLRAQPGVDRVVVVGHSEGALIGLALAAKGEEMAGLAMLSGSAHSGADVLRWQMQQIAPLLPRPVKLLLKVLPIDLAASQRKRMAKLEASTEDVVRMQGVKVNARWHREFMAFKPVPLLESLSVPTLAITGSNDIQVDPADVEAMRDLVPSPFEGHVVQGVNHILRRGDASPTTYKRQFDDPVDAEVTGLLTAWVERIAQPPALTSED